uniref:PWWP domain-containing protein n=1 Tax=Trichogramma kaykai TaxID=54128 RepID=A0ABD2VXM9_9HYME
MSTETMTYKLGDLVWAKMKGYSPWPGRVSNPIKDMKKPATTKKIPIYCIYFFGTNNYGWIDEANIKPYQEHKDQCKQMCKTANFKEACDTIENFISGGEVWEDNLDSNALFDKLKEEETNNTSSIERKTPKIKPKKLKTFVPLQETPKERKRESLTGSVGRPPKKQRTDSTSSNNRLGSLSPVLNHSASAKRPGSLLNRPTHISKPETPPLDVATVSQALKDKNIQASDLKFGFLGLGIMGSGIVKNLLNSGHKVVIWNRSNEKSQGFCMIKNHQYTLQYYLYQI